jgi:hypothetical protein
MKLNLKTKWFLDAVLFAAFILAFFLNLTGVVLHQWLGIAIGLFAAYHLIFHWNWVKAVTQRFFANLSSQSRMYYLLDAALLGGFFTIIVTGLIISTWLNLSLASFAAWKAIHVAASIGTLLVTLVKLVLHWRWIAVGARNLVAQPAVPAGRREFLKVAGAVGVASLAALAQTIPGLTSTSSSTTTQDTTSVAQAVSNTSSSSNTCQVICNRRCSYPGQCRRYVDTNGNNRCDNGECL